MASIVCPTDVGALRPSAYTPTPSHLDFVSVPTVLRCTNFVYTNSSLLTKSVAKRSTNLQFRPRAKMSQSSLSTKQQQQPVVQVETTIQNKHGERLAGILHETGSVELAILCHGFRSSKSSGTIAGLADALTKGGISVFCFDFAGNGDSEGSFEYGNYLREADDLRAVIEHFSGGKHAIVTILGHSKGGDVVLLYASKYSDVPTVVNVSGRYNLAKGVEERLGKDFMRTIKKDGFIDVSGKKGEVEYQYRVTEKSLMERISTDMHAACLCIDKSCKVLTVHGSLDETVPVEDAYDFSKVIPNHELCVIEGANHSFSNHKSELADAVLKFIKASIQQ